MKPHRLASMLKWATSLDLETDLIQPGLSAPPPVLGSAAEVGPHELAPNGMCVHCGKTRFDTSWCIHGQLLTMEQVYALFEAVLDNPEAILVGANIVFDLLVLAVEYAKHGHDVMSKIFAMYDPYEEIIRGDCDGRVFEIQLAEPLHAIAQGHCGKYALSREQLKSKRTNRAGRYSLDNVTIEVLGRDDAKVNDIFRGRYGQFRGVPHHLLPFQAHQYPVDDAKNTHEDALAQAGYLPAVWPHDWVEVTFGNGDGGLACKHCRTVMGNNAPTACMRVQPRRNLGGLARQAYFAWAAELGRAWGLHVPQDMVDALEKKVDDAAKTASEPFVKAGIIRENGTENQSVLKQLVAAAYGSRDICPTCNGSGRVPNVTPKGVKNTVTCPACDGTKLLLVPSVPRSDGGGVAKARDVLTESGNELLMEYAEQPSKKIKTTYIPMLRRGRACNVCGRTGVKTKYKTAHEDWCTAPNGEAGYRPIPLLPSIDPLKETERAAVEDGLHGIPRKGGIRECIRSRPGYVFSSEDYTAGELITLAHNCLRYVGWSKLAEALNKGIDVHTALAGTICGKSYDEMMKAKKAKEKWADWLRQVGKKCNFGFGGGMAELEFILRPCRGDQDLFTPCPGGPSKREMKVDGIKQLVEGFVGIRPCILMDHEDYCGRDGEKVLMYNDKPTGSPVCIRCLHAGKRARAGWFTQWPEMHDYFKHVKKVISVEGPSGTPEVTYDDGMIRGGVGYTDCANGYFQRTLAKAAKAAFCAIQRECVCRGVRVRNSEMMTSRFANMESPLYGSRAILLFHDETIAEHPESVASEAAFRVSELMVEALRWQCPKMYEGVKADPCLMRALYKGAEAVYQIGKDGDHSKPCGPEDRLIPWEPN